MLGNSMKKTGALLLFLVSFLALILSWEVKLLSTFGGIFVAGISFGGAVLMWLDVHESMQGLGKRDEGRAKADQ
ncbi:hypothetical protein SAMN04487897_102275 [Paenibacillus sp. yr247]|uniref:hypothetical protein n=1 Tax=Paenibacillus sp. yr247 TaxID=1761880 RepID=UPI000890B41F|nr:hypothetical protein [Paenibacillus sp. yr247]SDN24889.1 hypothetical protein SAMN04487897_102275 [Paenibacillus sp. yr247]